MAKKKETLLQLYERLEREQLKFIENCESNGKSYAHPQKGENIRRADLNELNRIQVKLAQLRANKKLIGARSKYPTVYLTVDGISEIKIILDAGMPTKEDVSEANPRSEYYPQKVVYIPYIVAKEDYGKPIAECDAHQLIRQGVQFIVAMNHMTDKHSHYESKQMVVQKI